MQTKIYFRDNGIYHAVSKIKDINDLYNHPKLGTSWEGFALEEVICAHSPQIDENDCYFWATQSGAELDLLIVSDNKRKGFEFKYTDVPKISKSMRIALNELKLYDITIISPGNHDVMLDEQIKAIGLEKYLMNQKLKHL